MRVRIKHKVQLILTLSSSVLLVIIHAVEVRKWWVLMATLTVIALHFFGMWAMDEAYVKAGLQYYLEDEKR